MVISLEVVDKGPAHTIARSGSVLLQRWMGEVDPRACEAALRTARAITDDGAAPGLIFIVHEAGAEMPAAPERAVLTAVGSAMPDSTCGCAFVFAGKGFKAAAARSVLTGMQLLAKKSYPVKFFGSIDDAIRWSAETSGLTAGELTGMVRELRDA